MLLDPVHISNDTYQHNVPEQDHLELIQSMNQGLSIEGQDGFAQVRLEIEVGRYQSIRNR